MAEFQPRSRRVRRRISRFPLRVFRGRLNPLKFILTKKFFRFIGLGLNLLQILWRYYLQNWNVIRTVKSVDPTALCVSHTAFFDHGGALCRHWRYPWCVCLVCLQAVREAVVILARNGRRSVRLRRDSHLCKAEFYAFAGKKTTRHVHFLYNRPTALSQNDINLHFNSHDLHFSYSALPPLIKIFEI